MKRLILSVAIGAGAMYLLDPEHGSERRARLLGFYGDNKDTFQDYAHTAAQTAVTVSHTVGDVASTVVDKAQDIAGNSETDTEKVAAEMINGTGSETGVGGRTRKSAATPTDEHPAPGTGDSLSS